MKTYKTKSAAVAAVKKQGLQNVPHTIDVVAGQFIPTFTPELPEDRQDLRERGWRVFRPS